MKKLIFFLICLLSFTLKSQKKDFVTIIPESKYNTSAFHNFFFGEHWRNVWNSEIAFQIIDYSTFSGGISPTKKGGGFQTKSLRFLAKDGRYWKFRSLLKDPSKVLPKELQETFVADILYDQISASHPSSPLIIAEFLNHFNISNSNPIYVFLKSDSTLAEFQNDFGDLYGTFEIHPDDDDSVSFPKFDKIDGTFDILNRLEDKREESFDAVEYLKARLLDIYFGDWDRHTDQWRWGRINSNLRKKWLPIPRDRDQVFARYDGILPSIVEYYLPQITSFTNNLPDVKKITWSGRYLDRRILPLLNKSEWDSVALFIHNGISDSLIEFAVSKLPPTHYNTSAKFIIDALKSRKSQLLSFSEEYFRLINNCIDIYGSSKDDFVEISANNEKFSVIFKKAKSKELLFAMDYSHCFTNEIRLHLLDGDDKVVISGEESSLPKIRIIGNDGKDSLINLTHNFSPFTLSKIVFYDSGKNTFISNTKCVSTIKKEFPKPKDDFEKFEPSQPDRDYLLLFYPKINLNDDDGLEIGGGYNYNKYSFRVVPSLYSLSLYATYATKPQSYSIEMTGNFYSIIDFLKLSFSLSGSTLEFTKYFGYGNESVYDVDSDDDEFYRIHQEVFQFGLNSSSEIVNNLFLNIGSKINFSGVSYKDNSYLASFVSEPFGIGKLWIANIYSKIEFDTRDNPNNSFSGINFGFQFDYFPKLFKHNTEFIKIKSSIASYFTFHPFTFAFRLGGEKINGTYPFFLSANLGGEDDLRGFSRQRFSGDAALFGQTEIRTFISDVRLILPAKFGIHFFYDTGRVFDNTNSKFWHSDFGGGIWLSLVNRAVTFSLTSAYSSEKYSLYLKTAMMF